jgi:alkylation response protein AidB-like acyl-CoA dehydrogenase
LLTLTDAQQQVQSTARRFSREVLAPNAGAWERDGAAPNEVIRQMGELGLFGLLIPTEFGGSGSDVLTFIIAMEEIAAGDGGLSTLMHVHGLGVARTLAKHGTEEQKRRWLPSMATGDVIGAFCLTEPQAGSDPAAIETRAQAVDGGWRISGTKQYITNGARAKLALVIAVTDKEAAKRGISAFLVPTGAAGFSVARVEEKMGQVTSDTAQILLENVYVGHDAVFGDINRALPLALGLLADGRVSVAAQATGMARAAYSLALQYARERKTFGKPLIDHQAIAFRLADMATKIEVTRAFAHSVARKIDAGENALKEASMAKLYGAIMAEEVCSAALDIHGGSGYIKGNPVERIYRDVRVCQIYEGTNDIQRMVISRHL